MLQSIWDSDHSDPNGSPTLSAQPQVPTAAIQWAPSYSSSCSHRAASTRARRRRVECRAQQRDQRRRRRQCPLSGDDATGGFTVPLPPKSLEVGEADSFAACAWTTASSGGAGSVRGPALLATVAGDEPGSEAEGWRSPDSREPGRGVRHRHCHAAVQSPRPGSLVAEPTGIGRSRGRASSRPLSAGCGGGERRARDASVKDLFRSALEPRERRHTSCSNRQRHATACSMQHATADTMGGVPVRFAARATWTESLSDLGQDTGSPRTRVSCSARPGRWAVTATGHRHWLPLRDL